MKSPLIIALFFLFSTQLHGLGLADWGETTSLGTVFNAPGDGIHLKTKHHGLRLRDLRSWYFYNGYIVGSSSTNGGVSYFLLNETSEEIVVYPLESEWRKAIEAEGLHPRIWLREYSGNWNMVYGLIVMLVVMFPVTVFLSLMQLFLVVRAIRFPTRGYVLRALFLPFGFFVLWLFSVFPGSV